MRTALLLAVAVRVSALSGERLLRGAGPRGRRSRVADQDYPDALERDSGRLKAVLQLTALRPDGSVLLRHGLAGTEGRATVEAELVVTHHADDCLAVQFTTTVRDVVVDFAPDALEVFDTVCDREAGDVAYR